MAEASPDQGGLAISGRTRLTFRMEPQSLLQAPHWYLIPYTRGLMCYPDELSWPVHSYLVFIQKSANRVEIKAHEKLYRTHMVEIPRNPFFAQRRYLSASGGSGKLAI
jgi:hypothetical protein